MKHVLLVGALAVALAGCVSVIHEDEYNQLVAQAENEVKLADKTGFLWDNTESFLKESKEAAAAADKADKAGNRAVAEQEFNKAMKLAKKAVVEAQLAQRQAKDNANPGVVFQ